MPLTTRIGLLSDTHLPGTIRCLDELGPACGDLFRGVDLILHAGDVCIAAVLDWLTQFAPVLAARGNNDHFDDSRLKPCQYLEIEGWRLGMAHILSPELRPLPGIAARCFDRTLDVMIGGHTHREHVRHEDGLLLVNPGSPVLPRHRQTRLGSAGLLEISPDRLHVEIVSLGETPGSPNPTAPLSLDVTRNRQAPAPA